MKHLTLLLCFLAISSVQSMAQRWNLIHKNSVDFIIGGEYGFRFLQNKSGDQKVKENLIFRNRYEDLKANLRIGFNYNMAVAERVFFKTGTRLTNSGFKADRLYLTNYENFANTDFFENVESFDYNYLFLEIPLMVRYVYSENWCESYVEAGFSANYYLQTWIKSYYRNDSFELLKIKENMNPFNFTANISIGAEFVIAQRIPAFIQMISRYQFTEQENNQIQENFWNAGLETGIRYAF